MGGYTCGNSFPNKTEAEEQRDIILTWNDRLKKEHIVVQHVRTTREILSEE